MESQRPAAPTLQLPMPRLNPFNFRPAAHYASFNGPNPNPGAIVCKNYAAFLINYVPNMKGPQEWVDSAANLAGFQSNLAAKKASQLPFPHFL